MPDTVTTVVTKRAPTGTIADAPMPAMDVKIVALSAVRIILIRTLRVFFQSFLASLTTSSTGAMAAAMSFAAGMPMAEVKAVLPDGLIGQLQLAASFGGFTALVTLVQNAAELFTKLDESRPTWRA